MSGRIYSLSFGTNNLKSGDIQQFQQIIPSHQGPQHLVAEIRDQLGSARENERQEIPP